MPPSLLAFLAETDAGSVSELEAQLQPLFRVLKSGTPTPKGYCSLSTWPVERSQQAGVPAAVITWGVLDERFPRCAQHGMVAWRDPETLVWEAQIIPWIGHISYYRAGRLAVSSGGAELALLQETCHTETGRNCHIILHLYRLEDRFWQEVWTAEIASEGVQREATWSFVGDGIDILSVQSTSVNQDDPRSQIFIESSIGPHRSFLDTWQKQGTAYVRIDRQVRPSAYNTLVEFLYALKTGGNASAWTSDPGLITLARQLDLAAIGEHPEDMWLERPSGGPFPEAGPLTVHFRQQRIIFLFVFRDGQYLLDAIQVTSESETRLRSDPG